MGKDVYSWEGVLDSNPTTPKIFTKRFRRTLATFEECPIERDIIHGTLHCFSGYVQCGKLL